MKYKFLVALACVFAISTTSCNSDEPAAPVPDNSFNVNVVDWGDVPVQDIVLSASIPDASPRSRVSDVNGFHGNGLNVNTLRYCIYKDDATKTIVQTDEDVAPTATASNTWIVRATLAAGVKYKVFFWADYAKTYDVDFTAHTVTADYAKTLDMVDFADAFCSLYDFSIDSGTNNGSLKVSLKRPFAQVCVLSRELDSEAMLALYPKTPYTFFGFTKSKEPNNLYLPNSWNFMDDTFTVASRLLSTTNTWIGSPNVTRTINGTTVKAASKVTYQGKEYKYVYMSFIFAPSFEQLGMDNYAMEFYSDEGVTRKGSYRSSGLTPSLTPNTRLIFISDADGSNDEPSFFFGGTNFTIVKSSDFDEDIIQSM